jgi:hypothetical protein
MQSTQEWVYRPRDVDLHFRTILRLQLTLWLVGWLRTPTRYLGVTPDTRFTWSPHVDQVRKKAAQRMFMLDPLLNRRSDLSIRNGVLLYMQLIRPMMDYGGPPPSPRAGACRCYNPSVFALLRTPPKGSGFPLIADHIRDLTANFDSKLADVGNSLVRKIGRYLR